MNKIIFLKGLPGSGKSTWAKKHAERINAIIVSKDDIRSILHKKWNFRIEKIVKKIEYTAVSSSLKNGFDVIIDSTNFAPKHEKEFRKLAEEIQVNFEVKYFNTPLNVCLMRNSKRIRDSKVPENVITTMWSKYCKK